MKSRLTSGPSALLGKDRVVAAVCTITTSAMSTASGATTRMSSQEIAGSEKWGAAPVIDPSVATPLRFETERNRRQPSEAKANESPGKPWAYAFAHEHDRKHAKADRQRPGIGRWSARDEGQGLLNKRTVIRFDAEHRGRLQNENMAGDAEEKARRHRNGQKVSDEAELEDAGANENEPDREAERRRGCRIMLWPRRREHRKRAGENRRDGRIGADRKAPAVAEKREPDRGGDKSKQTDLRREVGETGGRHLRGNGDRGERQAGDHVGAEVAGTPAGERPQNEPGAPSAKRRGGTLFA